MLQSLSIKNIALIREQTIEFTDGLNVLTGETGAGKSLIIDSLSLLLGEKADKSLISYGQTTASVEAVFTGLNQSVKEMMFSLGLDDEDSLVITRKINLEGKNECRVNGSVFTLSMLKKLSGLLMDLHGQFEHQNLLKVANHIDILDLYGGEELVKLKNEYYEVFSKYNEVQNQLENFTTDEVERQRLISLYEYQIEEIDNANFYDGEEQELKEFRTKVLNQEKIAQALSTSSGIINGTGYESDGVNSYIKKVILSLSSISKYYSGVESLLERLESVKIELQDIGDTIEQDIDNLYFDQSKAEQNEKRLDLLSDLKKKYGGDIPTIIRYREEIGIEYDKLVNSADYVEKLKKQLCQCEQELLHRADRLTKRRKNVALMFEKEVKKELQELGMKSSNFVVDFQLLDLKKRNSKGLDKVEFMFSANLGEQLKPLKAVASGGEMSRFMLAVKNITAKIENIGTLVFDEIDTGVSGAIALTLGQKLANVSKMAQVICVTHLSQVACFGFSHYLIEKFEKDGKTLTKISLMEGQNRVSEIARLISGNITQSSLTHAQEMLEFAKNN